MIVLIQRVHHARVEVNKQIIGQIDQGILALVGLEKTDTEVQLQRMTERLLAYRIFSDQDDKMNLSLRDIRGGLLLVSQFTLVADTQKGNRPSFSSAMPPAQAQVVFHKMCDYARSCYEHVQTGEFAADMQVYLQNDGPVSFILRA